MWQIDKRARVFLALGVTDMRKSIQGLSTLVESELEGRLFSGDLFVFSNRQRNYLKILYSLWSITQLFRACYRYLSNQVDHLDYPSAINQDLPIGSGEIESAHRYVLQARLKLAGAWW